MTALLIALSFFLTPQSAAMTASAMTVTPKQVAEFDMSRLRGEIRILTWNADGTQLYLETAELKSDALPKEIFHYVLTAATGALTKVDAEPAWSATYRDAMKFKSAPGDDGFMIALDTEQRRATATSIPMGGDYARGGTGGDSGRVSSGVSAEAVAAAASQSQSGTANVMRLNGQIVGEWLNRPIVPGQSYGWGPQGSNVIAYAEPNNRQLMVMDKSGAKKKIDDTKGVYSPAFSNDGKKLAWIEVRSKKATLVVAGISSK